MPAIFIFTTIDHELLDESDSEPCITNCGGYAGFISAMYSLLATDTPSIFALCDEYVQYVIQGKHVFPYHIVKHLGETRYHRIMKCVAKDQQHMIELHAKSILRAINNKRLDLIDSITRNTPGPDTVLYLCFAIRSANTRGDTGTIMIILRYMFARGYHVECPNQVAFCISQTQFINLRELLSLDILGIAQLSEAFMVSEAIIDRVTRR